MRKKAFNLVNFFFSPDRDTFTDDHAYECGDQKTGSTYLFLNQGPDVVRHKKTDRQNKKLSLGLLEGK